MGRGGEGQEIHWENLTSLKLMFLNMLFVKVVQLLDSINYLLNTESAITL